MPPLKLDSSLHPVGSYLIRTTILSQHSSANFTPLFRPLRGPVTPVSTEYPAAREPHSRPHPAVLYHTSAAIRLQDALCCVTVFAQSIHGLVPSASTRCPRRVRTLEHPPNFTALTGPLRGLVVSLSTDFPTVDVGSKDCPIIGLHICQSWYLRNARVVDPRTSNHQSSIALSVTYIPDLVKPRLTDNWTRSPAAYARCCRFGDENHYHSSKVPGAMVI
ncbi:hypothetical protein DXG01_006483 [Tephrocybe rancida]|nr:hypothetical protein DXG01_006483 [Tephrocybe rancida]